jgi:hypothetical protein
MSAGTPVYVPLAQDSGTNMTVMKASNASEGTSSKTMGLIATGGVAGDLVQVITEGLLEGLDTSTATKGDPVWLGPTGTLIFGLTNKPSAPAHLVFIGIVTRSQANNGEVFVKVQNGFELDELHNVALSSAANNEGLFYEVSAGVGLWKNKTIAAVLGYTPANDSGVVHIEGAETINGQKTFTSTVYTTSTLSINNGTLVGNNIVSMRANPTGGQFRIEKSDGSLSAYPFYVGVDGTALAYYYNASGALKVLLHTNGTSYFGNSLSIGYSTYAATSYMLDVNGTANIVGALSGTSATFSSNIITTSGAVKAVGRIFSTADNNYADLVSTTGTTTMWFGQTEQIGYVMARNYSTSTDLPLYLGTSLRVLANGKLQLTTYTSATSYTGTAAGYLAFDSSGNVITVGGISSTVSDGFSITTHGTANNTPSTPSVNIGVYNGVYAFIDLATQNTNGSWIDFSKGDGGDFAGRIRYYNTDDHFGFHTNGGGEKVTISSTGVLAVNGNTVLHAGNYSSYALPLSGGSLSGPLTITGNGSYLGDWGYKTLELNDTSGYAGIFFKNGANVWITRRNGADNAMDWAYSTNATSQGVGTFTHKMRLASDEWWVSTYPNYKMRVVGGDVLETLNGTSVTTLYLQYHSNTGGNVNIAASKFIFDNANNRLNFSKTSGTLIAHGSMTDAIGYNPSYGTYIGSPVGGTYYIYANGQMNNNGSIVNLLHSGNYSSYALPLSGGTLTGNRPIQFDTGGGAIFVTGNSGGWSMGTYYKGSDGVVKGGFGAYGGGSGFNWLWIGVGYDNTWAQINSSVFNTQVALQQNGNQVLHAGNYTSYSPSLTGGGASGTWGINITGNANNITQYTINQSLGTGNGPTFQDVYVNGWFRNNANNTGLYSQANNVHLYSTSDGRWNIGSGNRANGALVLKQDHETTIKGYLYWDGSGFGLLNNQGGWSVLCYQGASYGGELRGSWTMAGTSIVTNSGTWGINITGTSGYTNYFNTTFGADLESIVTGGIYRQETPSSGYNYTTTLNMNSSDGRQQMTIERGGGGMKFRGTATGSGTSWNPWRDVLHSANYTSYTIPIGGGWGADLTSNGWTRQVGVSYTGGEWVILTKDAQISTLIDGTYFAGESGGFYSLNSSNQYASRVGFNRDGNGYAGFNAIVNAPSGFVSMGNPWGTSNSAYFPNGITTAGSTNWIYGTTFLGNAPGNGAGHQFWSDGIQYSTQRVSIGTNDTSRSYWDGRSTRAGLLVSGVYYPAIHLDATDSNNTTHGAVISMTGVLSAGGYRRWGMGIANRDPSVFSIGWYDNQSNPHYGVGTGWSYPARLSLDTSGNLVVSGDITAYGSLSDINLKIIKEKVPNALDGLMKLSGYRFDWKEDKNRLLNIKEDIGVIAQEVEQVFPELARTGDNGNMSVRYQGLTAVLIEAVKEQQAQITAQGAQITELMEIIKTLKGL